MQCTPDPSQSNGANCLRVSVDDYRRRCHGRQGGYVQKPNCFFRRDLYPLFYHSSADSPSLSPPANIPPPHSTDSITKKGSGSRPFEKFRLFGTEKKDTSHYPL
ncbi:putative cysteine-rich receptor-like protein kinase 30 [Durio zibethinus]|uniref:Cysteine-rich receptor-like protein kinase 30 n=1 Tax=Durio zibethinus TaxID=66656 RepID=A0A6P5X5S9_DURZI|nr:putative cysteine-rich receptor-like protein kinase 30 [Durio zibethinus]